MRKIIVLEFMSLDGVIQAPGGPKEDTSGGFKFGGWQFPYFDDLAGKLMEKQMKPSDLLLGRSTYEIFASYWPKHAEGWPGINEVTKYVMSKSLNKVTWQNSVILKDINDLKKIKKSKGSDLHIYGSSKLVHSLLAADLVDELWLKIHPLILGKGKRLFDGKSSPESLKLIESHFTSKGVIFANYKRAGKIKTGSFV